jgi:hypothetical protein
MEPVLLIVTVLSLLMAVGLAVVAWRLLRENRSRSLARIEALHALVGGPSPDDDDVAEELDAALELPSGRAHPAAAIEREHTPLPAPAPVAVAPPALAAASVAPTSHEESWDLALRDRRRDMSHAETPPHVRPRAARISHAAPQEDLFVEPEQRTPSHRWSALVAVALVMALGIGGIYAAYSTDLLGAISRLASSRSGPATTNAGEAPLLLLSLRHTTEAGDFVLTGLIQNPSASPSLKGVVAVVYLFDKEGRYFASGKASLDTPVLASGAEAPFVIKISATQPIGRYRVGFRQEDGSVIAHVDRRGELPGGTTGDAIENTVPTATPVMRRSEG